MTQYDVIKAANEELAKALQAIDELFKMEENGKLKGWADLGACVFLLKKDIRAVLIKYRLLKPEPKADGYFPTHDEVREHCCMLFGKEDLEVECHGEHDYEILYGEAPLGVLFFQDGVWTCLKAAYDPGNRDTPPDWQEAEVGNSVTYYGVLYMLAMELEKDRIGNIIEAIGMEGIEECR